MTEGSEVPKHGGQEATDSIAPEVAGGEGDLRRALESRQRTWSVGLMRRYQSAQDYKERRANEDHGRILNTHNRIDAQFSRGMRPLFLAGDRLLAGLRNAFAVLETVDRRVFHKPKSSGPEVPSSK